MSRQRFFSLPYSSSSRHGRLAARVSFVLLVAIVLSVVLLDVSLADQTGRSHPGGHKSPRTGSHRVKEAVDWTSPLSVLSAVGRSITTSSVLTVNLTNALILAILKAIVIIAGMFGKMSFWTYPGVGGVPFSPFARSFQPTDPKIVADIESSLVSQEDIRWASMYMWSLNKRDFSCLLRLACENPDSAQVYIHAGYLLDGAMVWALQKIKWAESYNLKYKRILDSVKEASELSRVHGASNEVDENYCKKLYTCNAPFVVGATKNKKKTRMRPKQ